MTCPHLADVKTNRGIDDRVHCHNLIGRQTPPRSSSHCRRISRLATTRTLSLVTGAAWANEWTSSQFCSASEWESERSGSGAEDQFHITEPEAPSARRRRRLPTALPQDRSTGRKEEGEEREYFLPPIQPSSASALTQPRELCAREEARAHERAQAQTFLLCSRSLCLCLSPSCSVVGRPRGASSGQKIVARMNAI